MAERSSGKEPTRDETAAPDASDDEEGVRRLMRQLLNTPPRPQKDAKPPRTGRRGRPPKSREG